MSRPGARRERLREQLVAAYGEGLLSPGTFAHRIDAVVRGPVVVPGTLVGDLSTRVPRRGATRTRVARLARALAAATTTAWRGAPELPADALLALDWTGSVSELVLGRGAGCDVPLDGATVSRRHAQLQFRDGAWVLRDLGSRNGTRVNDVRVERCRLAPGDVLALGDLRLLVD